MKLQEILLEDQAVRAPVLQVVQNAISFTREIGVDFFVRSLFQLLLYFLDSGLHPDLPNSLNLPQDT